MWSLRFPSYPGTFDLWRCRECGVVFNWPRLPAEAIHDQYDADYYIFSRPPERRWGRACQLYIDHLLPLEHEGTNKQLLEVGCAQGDLLRLADHRGWEVQGIEISRETAASAEKESGRPICAGTLEEHASGLGVFDVVLTTDVIEHVPSPSRFVTAIRQVLRPGGLAITETPNWGGLWRRLAGRHWVGLNQFHIYLFTGSCLTRLMRRCGFSSCWASSGTHMAHVVWGERPEVTRLTACLPKPLRWRAERTLNLLTPASIATELYWAPPINLDEALARIDSVSVERVRSERQPGHLMHDNLTVSAQTCHTVQEDENLSHSTEQELLIA